MTQAIHDNRRTLRYPGDVEAETLGRIMGPNTLGEHLTVVETFYDVMSDREPVLAKLHVCDVDGKVDRGSRDRFALFLSGWLGGPDDYVMQHGHPRLRMRHGAARKIHARRPASHPE